MPLRRRSNPSANSGESRLGKSALRSQRGSSFVSTVVGAVSVSVLRRIRRRFLSRGSPEWWSPKSRRLAVSVPDSHPLKGAVYGRLDSRPGYSVNSWSTTEECCLIEMGGGNRPCEARQPAVGWPQGAKSGRAICEIRERREDAPLPRQGFLCEPALPFVETWRLETETKHGSGCD